MTKRIKILITGFLLFAISFSPVFGATNTTNPDFTDSTADNDYFTIIEDGELLPAASSFTYSVWINFISTAGTQRIIDAVTESGGNFTGITIYFASNQLTAQHLSGVGAADCVTNAAWTPSTATWYLMHFVHNTTANEDQFYINGATVGSAQSCTQDMAAGGGTARIAIDKSNNGDFRGSMDDFRVFANARSTTDIGTDYTAPAQLAGNESGLKVYYMFNNGAGTCGTTQLEDKGETTDPAGSTSNDLTNVNSVACGTSVPFVGGAAGVAAIVRRKSIVVSSFGF